MKCNLCEQEIDCDGKSLALFTHMKELHKDVHDLHKDNPEATVAFGVEFLHLNVLKDGDSYSDNKPQHVFLSEVCDTAAETEVSVHEEGSQEQEEDVINMQYVMLDTKRKYTRKSTTNTEQRKRSWIWKYFDKLSNIIYRCNLCNVVLSIKGCNTNNLNRHMRSRHPDSYKTEKLNKYILQDSMDLIAPDDSSQLIVAKEEYTPNQSLDSSGQKMRRSWIWSYFEHVSDTQAQCKLCHRQINHGGNATGNMNRHLKMIHHKTSSDNNWVWKVFDKEPSAYTCKICQQQLPRVNAEADITAIMSHLKKEHSVVSGDQIITGTECDVEEN